jgi:hypothetical protein
MWQSREFIDKYNEYEEAFRNAPNKPKPPKRTKKPKLTKAKKNIREFVRPDYHEYINSPRWKKRADRIKKRVGCCSVCKSTNNLNVHHKTYERLGRERNKDLVVLCRDCHLIEHDIPEDKLSKEFKQIFR